MRKFKIPSVTVEPPVIRILLELWTLWKTQPTLELRFLASCGWCDRGVRTPADSCLACIKTARRLQPLNDSVAWQKWRQVLREDLDAYLVVADWLEENDLLDAAIDLRAQKVEVCPQCKGTGRMRDKWLTTYPHLGERCPAWDCIGGKRFATPRATRDSSAITTTHFSDGPAAGTELQLHRSPRYLRVVQAAVGSWDALDLLNDWPLPDETIHVYQLQGEVGWMHVDFTDRQGRRRGRNLHTATYAVYALQPAQDLLADTEQWRAWAREQAQARTEGMAAAQAHEAPT
jgi:hypothetical protein